MTGIRRMARIEFNVCGSIKSQSTEVFNCWGNDQELELVNTLRAFGASWDSKLSVGGPYQLWFRRTDKGWGLSLNWLSTGVPADAISVRVGCNKSAGCPEIPLCRELNSTQPDCHQGVFPQHPRIIFTLYSHLSQVNFVWALISGHALLV